jgi:hypothetical protein
MQVASHIECIKQQADLDAGNRKTLEPLVSKFREQPNY